MGVPINANSDQLPDQFQDINFVGGEVPSSTKLNAITSSAADQFSVLSIGVGNTFIHNVPNLAAAVGEFSDLTTFTNPAGNIATVPIMFQVSNNINTINCTVGAQNGDGTWPVTLTNGQLDEAHHVITSAGPTYTIVNIVIARFVGSVMTDIHYGTFVPTGYAGGPVSTFDANTDLYQSTTDFVVLAANVSVVDALVQNIKNVGNTLYSNQNGRVNPTNDNTIDTETVGATVTNEINAIEDKLFTVRWVAIVRPNTGTVVGLNYTWNITASSATGLIGGTPTPATMSAYINNMTTSFQVGNTAVAKTYATSNGAVVTRSNGVTVPVGASYSGSTLTLSIPVADLANVPPSQAVYLYIPVKINYRLLQSLSLNYTSIGSEFSDLMTNVIGPQYGWSSLIYPNTIATRLDTNEASIIATSATVAGLSSFIVSNGSFEVLTVTGTPNQWTVTTSGTGTLSSDTTNNIHGLRAAKISIGASANSSVSLTSQTPIAISPNNNTIALKFRTYADATSMVGSIKANFYSDNGVTFLGSQTIWDKSSQTTGEGGTSWPTAWRTRWAYITVPFATARFMTLVVTGGGAGAVAGTNVWFDDVEFFSPGQSGKVLLESTGSGSHTITTPGNCTKIEVILVGAGGGGGGGVSTPHQSGGGGGAAGYQHTHLNVNPNTNYNILIGAGGGGGSQLSVSSATNGTDGGQSVFYDENGSTVLMSSGGGQGGRSGSNGMTGGNKGTNSTSGYQSLVSAAGATGVSGSFGFSDTNGGAGGGIFVNTGVYIQNSGGNGAGISTPVGNGAFGCGGGGANGGLSNPGGGSGGNGFAQIRG